MIVDHRNSLSKRLSTRSTDSKAPPPPYAASLPNIYAEEEGEEDNDGDSLRPPARRFYTESNSVMSSSSRVDIQMPETLPDLPPEASATNHLHVCTRSKDITGTYFLDPCLPSPVGNKHKNEKTNASFRSSRGNFILTLATVCTHADKAKSLAMVETNTGDIIVSLLDMPSNHNISLDLASRRGNISLLIPRSFCGVLQLRTRKGSIEFLNALAPLVRVLKDTEEETLVLIGNSKTIGDSTGADFCQLTSRFGKLAVGLKGEDKVAPPEPTFWEKLGKQLRGGTSDSQEPI
ncbi:hypothetical protein HGRIS_005003 [Hohenbuehelia grisea]|uniref:DUF7330 domain-containing protein n=1 Tax=Hohenbuehelia grisea TaxID=104357 RepID=A0ABR3JDM7_9AGAR